MMFMKKEVDAVFNMIKKFFDGDEGSIIGLTQLREESVAVKKEVKKEIKAVKKDLKISDLMRVYNN